jgi:hypothetical protein
MHRIPTSAAALVLLAFTPACTLHDTSTRWNGRVGIGGKQIFVKTSTNIGFNLGIVLPVLGNITTDRMIDAATAEIARDGSNHLRVIQTTSENYWYGFPPFTWIVTPVITEVAIEYQPSPIELARVANEEDEDAREIAEPHLLENGRLVPVRPRR